MRRGRASVSRSWRLSSAKKGPRATEELAALLVLLFVSSGAQGAPTDDAEPGGATEPHAEQPAGRAAIVLVSQAGGGDELAALFSELLGRQGVTCELSEAPRFEPDALFSATADDSRVLVFVVIGKKQAQLYFRGPGGERFLLRKLALDKGLDDVGRELVGQVVESSTLALLRSSEGISRAQASVEVEREVQAAREKEPPKADRPAPRAEPSPFEFVVLAVYQGQFAGPDLGFAHGPGIDFGVGYRRGIIVRLGASAAWHFPQALELAELGARVQTIELRGGAFVGLAFSERMALLVGVAAGADRVSVTPERAETSDIQLAAESRRFVPMLRPELRYELVFRSLVIAADAFLDASLADTHYDLVENGEHQRLGAPWSTRPGAFLGVGLIL